MKITSVIIAVCLGMMLYRVSSDALTEGGKVDTARGLGRLVNRIVFFFRPNEGFSPYYFPTTIDPKHSDAMMVPKSSRTLQESTFEPLVSTTATRVSPGATAYPIFETPESQNIVPRASNIEKQ
jgi:hypothetical protein